MIIGHVSNTVIGRHYTEADMGILKELLDRADHGIEIAYSACHSFRSSRTARLSPAFRRERRSSSTRTATLAPSACPREDDDSQILALAIREADMPARPDWSELRDLRPRSTAPDALADVLREYVVLPPGNEACRRAFDHFLAMASSSSETKVTDGSC